MRLRPLIHKPRNAPQRKEQRKRLGACEAHLAEVERLGRIIHIMSALEPGKHIADSEARATVEAEIAHHRMYLIEMQNEFARDLRLAGYPMDGTVPLVEKVKALAASCSPSVRPIDGEKYEVGS